MAINLAAIVPNLSRSSGNGAWYGMAKGMEYARFSIDSPFTRNYLYSKRYHPEKLNAHVPEFAKRIVSQYQLPKS